MAGTKGELFEKMCQFFEIYPHLLHIYFHANDDFYRSDICFAINSGRSKRF